MKTSRNRKQKATGKRRKKLTRKQIILICVVLVLIVAAAGGVWFWTSAKSQPDPSVGQNTVDKAEADQDKTDQTNSSDDTDEEGDGETDSKGDGETDSKGDGETDSSGKTGDSAGENGQTGENSGSILQEGVHGLSLPYSITGSSLVIRGISSYDGIYLEDGSDSDISGVTVIVLQNTGDTIVEYASVSISRDGTALQFDASAIPAGGSVVVQEKNRTSFQEGNYTDCTATVAEISEFEMSEDQVKVEESGNQSLTVTNLTDQTIPAVRIFYKFYMEDEDTYVGGITYSAKITQLEAGGTQTVTPSHYMEGSSKIMMIRTYDTTE